MTNHIARFRSHDCVCVRVRACVRACVRVCVCGGIVNSLMVV